MVEDQLTLNLMIITMKKKINTITSGTADTISEKKNPDHYIIIITTSTVLIITIITLLTNPLEIITKTKIL